MTQVPCLAPGSRLARGGMRLPKGDIHFLRPQRALVCCHRLRGDPRGPVLVLSRCGSPSRDGDMQDHRVSKPHIQPREWGRVVSRVSQGGWSRPGGTDVTAS